MYLYDKKHPWDKAIQVISKDARHHKGLALKGRCFIIKEYIKIQVSSNGPLIPNVDKLYI